MTISGKTSSRVKSPHKSGILAVMLTNQERSAVVAAVEEWAAAAPERPALGFVGNGRMLTAADLATAVRKGTEDGEAFMQLLEHGVRREGLETVVRRFHDSLVALETTDVYVEEADATDEVHEHDHDEWEPS